MKQAVALGTTDYTAVVFIQDSSSTTGAGLTGLDDTKVDAYYWRVNTDNDIEKGDVGIADLTAITDAHSDGGFIEIDSTNLPGFYRLDLPDALFVTGNVSSGVRIYDAGANNVADCPLEFQLLSPTRGFSGTALPDAAADAAGGLPISDAGGLDLDAKIGALTFTVAGDVDVNVQSWKGSAAPDNTGDAYARLGAPAGASVSADVASVKSDTAAVLVDTNELQTDWTDGGRLDLLLDATKAKTDGLNFTGTDVKATLDGEEVTPTAASKTGYTLVAGTGLGNQTADIAGTITTVTTVTNGVTLANGAITDASLAGNMEIVFETDFATNYNQTRNAWTTNAQDFVGTSAADPFNGTVVAASVTGAVTVGTNNDKTGYTVSTVSDKTGYSLAADQSAVTIGTVTTLTNWHASVTDWTDGGRLDLILDAIAGDVINLDGAAMRGTDSAALASVWTPTVAGRIDAAISTRQATVANLADAVTMAAQFSTMVVVDGAVYDFTAEALEAGGGSTPAEIADAVWDEATSGHTTAGTFGRLIGTTWATLFNGITSLASWLGAIAGKTADTSTRTEINATTAGAGYNETTDSQEALRDRGDVAWITGGGLDAAGTRAALGMTSADLDDQLDAILVQATAAAGAAGGAGARTVVITVNDGTDPIESAKVRLTKGAETYLLSTDVSGQVTFNLDDGSWTVAISLAGYTYAGTTLTVDGDETATYSMTLVTISASNPGFTTGYGYVYDEDGALASGITISAKLTGWDSDLASGYAFDGATRTATSDANGLYEFTNMFQGANYDVWRGDGAVSRVTIGTSSTQALPTFVGID